ncbi:hypothetical protein [Paenibacillus odorifer]|uniref:Uncharacterized protein n=1 Tax=Paenibacillus odorifer TaxID=189426 RepID=A0A1R0XV97_9BACL|nr:hypothetical protein [Paenibacillus odorifer]OMD39025.1 hypothetical protein BSK52_17340 [Paenibacillus odorifer]
MNFRMLIYWQNDMDMFVVGMYGAATAILSGAKLTVATMWSTKHIFLYGACWDYPRIAATFPFDQRSA